MESQSFVNKFISIPRFQTYRCHISDSESDIWQRYLWNIALCESCYPVLNLVEVALRNGIDHVLSEKFAPDWLSEDSPILARPEQLEIRTGIIRLQKNQYRPMSFSHGDLVAVLHFGFWNALFRNEYADMWNKDKLLQKVFEHIRNKDRTAAFIFHRLKRIRRFRNRVFHHEPIWNGANLPQRHAEILETLGGLSPELKIYAQNLDRFDTIYNQGTLHYLK